MELKKVHFGIKLILQFNDKGIISLRLIDYATM